ncbi:NBS-containing resistance-like protein, partial [Trifolium medium]|nr:NBS-containing resistance-like protein [Trifolium medium]
MSTGGVLAERFMRARVELMKENSLDIGMPIILNCDDIWGAKHRRFWGIIEIKLGDPFYKPVLRKLNQLSWKLWASNEASRSNLMATVVELKCKPPGIEEALSSSLEESLEEGHYDPELEELMRRIEQDVMSLNKSYGKMKASIIQTDKPISKSYILEALIFRRLVNSRKLTMLRYLTKFKITPYGKMRAEDDSSCVRRIYLWGLSFVQFVQIIWPYLFI